MPKRLTDTEIWNKYWFQILTPKYKCFIRYLFDKCNHAGIWEVNKKVMEMFINARFSENLDELLDKFQDHIIKISNTKWFIVDFIPFQYNCSIDYIFGLDLKDENNKKRKRVLLSVRKILDKYNIKQLLDTLSIQYRYPIDRCKDKDKDKDKDKVKDKDKENKFNKIWEIYPRKDGMKEALRHFNATVKTDENWENINKALNNYKKHIETNRTEPRYIKKGSTWFNNWQDWVNWEEPKGIEKKKRKTLLE